MSASFLAWVGFGVMAGQAPVVPPSIAAPSATMIAPPSATIPTPPDVPPAAVPPVAAPATPPAAAPADPTKPTPVPSRIVELDIVYDPASRKNVQRMLLYVSRDQGQTWELEATALPEQETFKYTAKDDGVFWCKMQAVMIDGKKVPSDITRTPPDHRLFLDGTPPVVRIASAKKSGDEISVEWIVEEKFPEEAGTIVRYKPVDAPDSAWVNVPVTGSKKSVQFKPAMASASYYVEVIARDQVGLTGSMRATIGSPAPSPTGVIPAGGPPVMPITPGENLVIPNLTGAPTPPTETPKTEIATPPAPSIPTMAAPKEPVPLAVTTTRDATPVLPNARPINFARFDLSYHLTAGPSGVSRIDLWVTRDDGKTWRKWSQHDGRESPLKVVLDVRDNPNVEGLYGFRLVPESGAKLADLGPATGSSPEFRVLVDLTAPTIQVFEPAASSDQPGVVLIRWKATDANFGNDPIAVEWSESQAGPWRSVSGGDPVAVVGTTAPATPRLANTGEFAWRLPADLPNHKVFLKFTAWDLAGNKSEAVTRDPILVDLTKPRASIQGIVGPQISK